MKIDFNEPILTLSGKPNVEPNGEQTTMAKLIAVVLSQGQSEEPIKSWVWAKQLYTDGVIELDDADKIKFKALAEKFQISDFAKAQILMKLQS